MIPVVPPNPTASSPGNTIEPSGRRSRAAVADSLQAAIAAPGEADAQLQGGEDVLDARAGLALDAVLLPNPLAAGRLHPSDSEAPPVPPAPPTAPPPPSGLKTPTPRLPRMPLKPCRHRQRLLLHRPPHTPKNKRAPAKSKRFNPSVLKDVPAYRYVLQKSRHFDRATATRLQAAMHLESRSGETCFALSLNAAAGKQQVYSIPQREGITEFHLPAVATGSK